jgi:hypothetical protein
MGIGGERNEEARPPEVMYNVSETGGNDDPSNVSIRLIMSYVI